MITKIQGNVPYAQSLANKENLSKQPSFNGQLCIIFENTQRKMNRSFGGFKRLIHYILVNKTKCHCYVDEKNFGQNSKALMFYFAEGFDEILINFAKKLGHSDFLQGNGISAKYFSRNNRPGIKPTPPASQQIIGEWCNIVKTNERWRKIHFE